MSELEMQEKKRENVVAGIVGAFLGSLLGVACTVLVGQLGYVAAISGLVMAVCSLKGYELLGGRLGKTGVIVSSILIVVMTYLAHQLDWAISVASALEAGILESFRAIPYLREAGAIEARSYWGGLVMLYLFTLVGAVPTIIAGLRGDTTPDLPPAPPASAVAGQETDLVIYPPQKGWTRPMRLSLSLPMLIGVVAGLAALLVWGSMGGDQAFWIPCAAIGCILSAFVMMFAALPYTRLSQAEYRVMVRSGGTLWQVELSALNAMDTFRYTKKNGNLRALRWDMLPQEDQERARASIARAIELLQSGQLLGGSALSRAVLPLTDLQVEGEDNWRWKGTYSVSGGKRKKISIAKAYPDFAPAAGMERTTEPMPWRWSFFAIALLVALVLGAAGAVWGGQLLGDRPGGGAGSVKAPARPEAQAPERTASYTLEGVTFQMDAALQADSASTFSDPQRELRYTVFVQHGRDLDDAKDALLQPISDYRTRSDFDSFSFVYAQEEDVMIPMTAADGASWQHGLLSVYLTGGDAIQNAVALSEDGTLFAVTAYRDESVREEELNSALLFILESLQVSDEARAMGQITDENYQSLFHREEENYSTIGVGYIKVPEDMYGYEDAFVDAYVPYSDMPEYLDGGYTLRSANHGMAVQVTMTHTDGDARNVVDGAFEALAASGVELYEDGVSETFYEEDYDIAYKQALYFTEDGAPQVVILYADVRQNGYYLDARITYLLDQTDEDYPLTVAELGDAYSLSLPELDPYEA